MLKSNAGGESDAALLPTFDNEQAWYGPDMASRGDWIHTFTPAEVAEIDAAVGVAEGSPTS